MHVRDGVVDVEWQRRAVLEVVGEGLQLVGVRGAGSEVLDRGAGVGRDLDAVVAVLEQVVVGERFALIAR